MRDESILLGVTGGVAAYKAAELARLFVKEGAEVRVVMTRHACEFVAPLTFEALTGRPVALEMFAPRTEPAAPAGENLPQRSQRTQSSDARPGHIGLARWAKVLVVAPATANAVAKLALGLADDLLSTTALAFSPDGASPLVVAPAMNSSMWRHPAVQANVATLRERGVTIVGPAEGELACGETGPGRMAEPADILEAVRDALQRC